MSYPPIRPAIRPRTTYYDASRRRRREEEFSNNSRKDYNNIDNVIEEKIQEIFEMEYGENNDNSKITLIHFFEEFMGVYNEQDYSLVESEYEELSKKLQLEEQINDELMNKLRYKLVTIQIYDLNLDMLRNNESSSYFRRKYDSLNQNGKEDILMKEIEKLEKKIKYNPFTKNKNQLLLAEKIEELERIHEAKAQAEEFESLTPEDKKEIIEYFLSKEKLNNLELQLYYNSKERAEYNSPEIGVRRAIRTWNKMLNSSKISDEILDELFEKLDKVGLDTEKGKHLGFSVGVQDPDDDCRKYSCGFISFLESVRKVYQNARGIDSSIKNIAFSQTTSSIKNGIGEIRSGIQGDESHIHERY